MANPRVHDVASQATDSIRCPRAEGLSIYWITQGLYLTCNCLPQYIWGYFAEMYNKSHWILQRIYRLKVCNRRAFALPRRCRVSLKSEIRCPRAEGLSIYWITQGLYLTCNCVPQYIWGYFAKMYSKSNWILQRIYRSKVCNRRAFALPRRCRVSLSSPSLSGETITVI